MAKTIGIGFNWSCFTGGVLITCSSAKNLLLCGFSLQVPRRGILLHMAMQYAAAIDEFLLEIISYWWLTTEALRNSRTDLWYLNLYVHWQLMRKHQ